MKRFFTLILSCSLSMFPISRAFAQDFLIEWQNTIGGAGTDSPRAVYPTNDGGCVMAGSSFSNASGDKSEDAIGSSGQNDYWVVKVNASGVIQWENTIGGDQADTPSSIKQTSDGGYIIAGESFSNASGDKTEDSMFFDFWVIKLNSVGVIEWDNTISGSSFERSPTVLETSDGGFLLGGISDSGIGGDKTEPSNGGTDFWVLKLDDTGTILWQNTIGGSSSDGINALIETSDGGFVLGGVSASDISGDKTENGRGGGDYWIVKINDTGAVEWDKTIGGPGADFLESVYQTPDGGYILGGFSSSDAGGEKSENSLGLNDYWVVKLDASRNVQWENTIGALNSEDLGYTYPSDDGGYVVIGHSNSDAGGDKIENSNGSFDLWFVKLNASGTIIGQNTIGGSEGDVLFFGEFAPSGDDLFMSCSSFSDISGDKTEDNVGSNDYWTLKLGNILSIANQELANKFTVFPNPTQNYIEWNLPNALIEKIALFDINGKLITSSALISENRVDVSHLSDGLYFIKITSEGQTIIKKFIKK